MPHDQTITGAVAPEPVQPLQKRSPVIGVALGGGVARGWAHIGVLQRLEEIGVRPDVVAGTSVGALAGAYWLAGQLPALDAWARSFSRRRMFGYFDLALNGSGLIAGKRLRAALTAHLGELTIEALPAEFVAVAADLVTGHEKWLRAGNLVDAIEASYSLPGLFPPRAVDGQWLIDGALVNPMPVSVCRSFGARLVIAVGLHADALGRVGARRREAPAATAYEEVEPFASTGSAGIAERLMLRRLFRAEGPSPGLGTVMLSAFNIVMDRVTRSRLAGDPPDVQIMPQAGHVGLLEFDRADELITLGREAVDYARPRIEAALEILR